MSITVAEHDAVETIETATVPSTPNIGRYAKIRKISIRVALVAAAILAADTARVITLRSSPAIPMAADRQDSISPTAKPDRDTPLPELFYALRDPKEAAAFLKQYQTHDTPQNPLSFTTTFRTSAQEFLKRGSGCCNNYAEFWGELWMATGRKPYLVSMWPTRERCSGKKNEGIKGKGWHMIAVYSRINPETHERQLVIGDNDDAVFWDKTLEEYAASKGMAILPFGGIQPFQPAADDHDFRAKICDLSRGNASMQVSTEPVASVSELMVASR